MKTGGSRSSLLAVAGGLGNVANIPGSETITTAIAISLANRPKIAGLAVTAGAAIMTGGVGAAVGAGGGGVATGTGAVEAAAGTEGAAAQAATGGKKAATSAEKGIAEEGGTETGEGTGVPETAPQPEKEISGRELGEIPTPFEELERLTGPEGVTEDTEKNEVDLRNPA